MLIISFTGPQSSVQAASTTALKTEAGQLIVVEASPRSTSATLQRYVKKNGKWVKYSPPIKAVVGKYGIGKLKEGDGKTPAGTYLLGTSFGWGKKPAGLNYPFKAVSKYDYWIDDVKSKDYNKWVHYTGNPDKRWNSYEKLNHPLYKYSIVIRYNENPIVKEAGSAIFLHIKSSSTKHTLGCIAVNEGDMLNILKWLDPKKKPVIEIKPTSIKITVIVLNVRSGASKNHKIVGQVKKNKVFTVKDVVLNSQRQYWLKIEYAKGKYGWISAKYTNL
ncbi:SH3 domain-containing protein [Bacillus sp. FJAT-18017]|uniref:SH3 domain-containing protein n=1 Tax=Bacillus sp. FJAT-18017 TaxID=1705566 RepID=UPI001E3C4C55|nr:SH3 domain-containing protein [Bacillus sp. FJAT-18017]